MPGPACAHARCCRRPEEVPDDVLGSLSRPRNYPVVADVAASAGADAGTDCGMTCGRRCDWECWRSQCRRAASPAVDQRADRVRRRRRTDLLMPATPASRAAGARGPGDVERLDRQRARTRPCHRCAPATSTGTGRRGPGRPQACSHPPCRRASSRLIDRPRPVPPVRRLRDGSARQNRSNTSAASPGPQADPVVPDGHRDRPSVAAQGDLDRPALAVLDRVDQKVAQDPLHPPAVDVRDHRAVRHVDLDRDVGPLGDRSDGVHASCGRGCADRSGRARGRPRARRTG